MALLSSPLRDFLPVCADLESARQLLEREEVILISTSVLMQRL